MSSLSRSDKLFLCSMYLHESLYIITYSKWSLARILLKKMIIKLGNLSSFVLKILMRMIYEIPC